MSLPVREGRKGGADLALEAFGARAGRLFFAAEFAASATTIEMSFGLCGLGILSAPRRRQTERRLQLAPSPLDRFSSPARPKRREVQVRRHRGDT